MAAGARQVYLIDEPIAAALGSGIDITLPDVPPLPGCRCGQVLKGRITPPQCPLFGKACTPASPVGPCMVSTEGSCAAYFKYMT